MKKYSNKELSEILTELKRGAVYTAVRNGTTYGDTIRCDYFNHYICFTHYGSSAVKSTIKDLKWLLNTIFNDCDCIVPAVYSDYHISYIAIDKNIPAFDRSSSHPNVCGV